jgi:hypothetical protein
MYTLIVPCFAIATLLAAQTYVINVSVDNNTGNVKYDHKKATHGFQGHVVAHDGDTITWQCGPDGTCTALSVQFKNRANPCGSITKTSTTSSCTVNTNGTPLGVIPYTIAVTATGNSVVIDDPDVIVDNVGMFEDQSRKGPSKKGSGPKK